MNRGDLKELHYITPIANVPSILKHGILCKNDATRFNPRSVAMPEIQQLRANKVVPGGMEIHRYANLYICARNPMMYKRSAMHVELCVLSVNPSVLDLPDVVIADSNAASKYTAFWASPAGLAKVDRDRVFGEDWRDPDQITQWRRAAAKCAEVLVPACVPSGLIEGAYVSCDESRKTLVSVGFQKRVWIDPHMFFRG